jgi:hypothetical protein
MAVSAIQKFVIAASGLLCGITGCRETVQSDEQASRGSAASSAASFCQNTWEEKPGTTDYTAFDSFAGRQYAKPDRPQSATLIGSKTQQSRSLCNKARFLKTCFDKAVLNSNFASAKTFRSWAAKRGVHPALALMAKAEQETKLGLLADSCRGGNCNGIGIGQIITAFDENGKLLSDNDRRWEGITFNILTNLNYSVRVLAVKTSQASSLWDLAYRYNGSGLAKSYADKVVGYYTNLKSCGLY